MEILLYNVKVSICLIAFYLLYRLLLSHETFVRMNRIVLLSMVGLSFVLPRCGITWQTVSENAVSGMSISMMLDEISVAANAAPMMASGVGVMNWQAWCVIAYWLGVMFFAFRLVLTVVHIVMMTHRGERKTLDGGVKLVLHETGMAPFSWMGHVWMSRSDYEENGHEILTHEIAHIRYGHSVDLMIMDVICSLLWFNPAMWLMRMELCAVHEYEADKAVLDSGINARQYQILLIKKAAGSKWSSVANSFNHSKLKSRIAMMLRKESSAWARAKVLCALPIIGGAMIAFANVACSESEDNENVPNGIIAVGDFITEDNMKRGDVVKAEYIEDVNGAESVKYYLKSGEEFVISYDDSKETFMIVEDMPEFPGGMDELGKFIAENVRYPKEAMEKNISGRVFVHFVVDENGNVVEVRPARDTDPILNAEAIRIVSMMPQWKPGLQRGKAVRVSYTVPINFVLE